MRQFLIVQEGTMSLATEDEVSRKFDMADCDEPFEVFTLEDGKLVPVNVGEKRRLKMFDFSLVYATAPMLVGNKVVGCVDYTDH